MKATSLFNEEQVLALELRGPVGELVDNKANREERPFVLRSEGFDHPVMIRLRGKSRIRVCEFPPLRVRFENQPADNSPFGGLEKLKLVTHCREGGAGDSNVLEEYLAYRIFNLISEASYRVRLMEITYWDVEAEASHRSQTQFGIALEPTAHLERRLDGQSINVTQIGRGQLDLDHAAAVFVFQYLIGNTDWSMVIADEDDACCHNGELILVEGRIRYIPFDFDLAGIVNARYARPDPSLKLHSVRTRRYRGYCVDMEFVARALRRIRSLEGEILSAVEGVPWVTSKDGTRALDYLERFFDRAQNEERLLKTFRIHCLD